jgi:copper chaperone NosL
MRSKNRLFLLKENSTSFINITVPSGLRKRIQFLLLCCMIVLPLISAQEQKKCSYCEMIYQFPNFGGEIITVKNDTLWYDATECLASVIARKFVAGKDIKSMRSINYLNPTEWINTTNAYYLHRDKIQSPMSMNISAYRTKADAAAQQKNFGGELLRWKDVVELINRKWFKK